VRNHVSERPEVGREIGVRSLPLQQDQMQAGFNFLAQEPEIVYQQLNNRLAQIEVTIANTFENIQISATVAPI
jgi:hypothetical protein